MSEDTKKRELQPTPFDMVVMNDLDRLPMLDRVGIPVKQEMRDRILKHKQYIAIHGDDMSEIRDWKWPEISE